MPLIVHTARIGRPAWPDALDVTRKSAPPEGLPFAPSWEILGPALAARRAGQLDAAWPGYVEAYTAEMRRSYRAHRPAWDALLSRESVTLLCYCADPRRCHRTLLAGMLARLGADVRGEREGG